MSNADLFLGFTCDNPGGGSVILKLSCDDNFRGLKGDAHGAIRKGTQDPQNFCAAVTGELCTTNAGKWVKVGSVSGEARVLFGPPPVIGEYTAPFSASFSVDANWDGYGQFVVGSNTYHCLVRKFRVVSRAETSKAA